MRTFLGTPVFKPHPSTTAPPVHTRELSSSQIRPIPSQWRLNLDTTKLHSLSEGMISEACKWTYKCVGVTRLTMRDEWEKLPKLGKMLFFSGCTPKKPDRLKTRMARTRVSWLPRGPCYLACVREHVLCPRRRLLIMRQRPACTLSACRLQSRTQTKSKNCFGVRVSQLPKFPDRMKTPYCNIRAQRPAAYRVKTWPYIRR